jgi:DNA-binding winged helix-turn-helix (wHTH) protein/TolB-like protein/Tfp pilus assembly protein PilF
MPTKEQLMKGFEFGRWSVLPERGLIRDGAQAKHVEPLVMDVFVLLASHAGEVVSRDQLVDAVWKGRPVTDEVITRCIAVLRRNLEDDAKSPQFIETLPRRGYRVMQTVSLPDGGDVAPVPATPPRRVYVLPLIAGIAAVVVIVFFGLRGPKPRPTDETPIQTVAVFQFDCLYDAEMPREHLCFGFSEETISGLNQVGSLNVVRYRHPYREGLDSGQQGVVTGSVQIIGDKVKIAAQLEDVRNGHVVWSNVFDASAETIFRAQKQVALAISRAIDRDYIAPSSVRRSPEAEESYALARYLFEKRERKATLDAIRHFEEAIRLDPDYGPAWLGLAYTYIIWPDYDVTVDREAVYDLALKVVAAGIAADPGIVDAAGTVYGFIHHKRNNWVAAAEAFETAINARSVQPIAHAWYSRALASVGRLDAALEHAQLAMERDPQHPDQAIIISRMAITSFWLNDLAAARRYFDIASTMQLEAPIHSLAHALFLIRTNQIDDARRMAKLGLEQNGLESDWIDPAFLGFEQPESQQQSIDLIANLAADQRLPPTVEITLWALYGEVDRAMAVARRLEDNVGSLELEIIFIDEFADFRQHPEFPAFVEAIGLNTYWSNAGCTWRDDKVTC